MANANKNLSNKQLTKDLAAGLGLLDNSKSLVVRRLARGFDLPTKQMKDQLRDALADTLMQSAEGRRQIGEITQKIADGDIDQLNIKQQELLQDALGDTLGVLTAKLIAKEDFYEKERQSFQK